MPGVRVTPGARTFLVRLGGTASRIVGLAEVLVSPRRKRRVADREVPAGDPEDLVEVALQPEPPPATVVLPNQDAVDPQVAQHAPPVDRVGVQQLPPGRADLPQGVEVIGLAGPACSPVFGIERVEASPEVTLPGFPFPEPVEHGGDRCAARERRRQVLQLNLQRGEVGLQPSALHVPVVVLAGPLAREALEHGVQLLGLQDLGEPGDDRAVKLGPMRSRLTTIGSPRSDGDLLPDPRPPIFYSPDCTVRDGRRSPPSDAGLRLL
ncbi:MAG TPA: hypothetical protein VFE97_07500 [Methylomirabilota bacterium]|nr:hypothetical protein [Methylomirabilota bacterium]